MQRNKLNFRPQANQLKLTKANELKNQIIGGLRSEFCKILSTYDQGFIPDYEAIKANIRDGAIINPKLSALIEWREYELYMEISNLIKVFELSHEAFEPIIQVRDVADIDRLDSMYSGPFFTSIEYPIPSINSHCLIPIIQLNLSNLPNVFEITTKCGLLQLWYDMETFNHLLRLIPSDKVSVDLITEFKFRNSYDVWFTPSVWAYQRNFKSAEQIVGFSAKGMCTDKISIKTSVDLMQAEIKESLKISINNFLKICANEDSTHLYGTFNPIQYSNAEVGHRCFFNISGWGIEGNLQVFIKEIEVDDRFIVISCQR